VVTSQSTFFEDDSSGRIAHSVDSGRAQCECAAPAATDVDGTVTDLDILDLEATDMAELQETFSLFDKSRGECVTKLQLSTLFPLVDMISASNCLRELLSLKFWLT